MGVETTTSNQATTVPNERVKERKSLYRMKYQRGDLNSHGVAPTGF
jgi:hypothetical protein